MQRLDQYLVQNGHMPSRDSANEEIRAGKVTVNGVPCLKPGYKIKNTDQVEYLGEGRRHVSRGAAKLLEAIRTFSLDIQGKACIDVGASTGGFTQILLESGAASVAAVDVGHGQLDPSLRADPKVEEFSGLNFREIPPEQKDKLKDFDLLTMDVSFISVCLLETSVRQVVKPGGTAVILIKPQFEAGRGGQNKNGVVKDPKRHIDVLRKVVDCYEAGPFQCLSIAVSPIKGPEGNIEYLCHLVRIEEPSAAKGRLSDRFLEETVQAAFERFE